MKPQLSLSVLLVLSVMAPVATANTAVSFMSANQGLADGIDRMIGWQFTVGSSPIRVSDLGFYDHGTDGLIDSHQVGIFQASDNSLVGSATVSAGTAAPLNGFFRYVPLQSSLLLSPGNTYVIGAFDSGNDPHVWDTLLPGFAGYEVNGFAVDPAIAIGAPGTARGAPAASE